MGYLNNKMKNNGETMEYTLVIGSKKFGYNILCQEMHRVYDNFQEAKDYAIGILTNNPIDRIQEYCSTTLHVVQIETPLSHGELSRMIFVQSQIKFTITREEALKKRRNDGDNY